MRTYTCCIFLLLAVCTAHAQRKFGDFHLMGTVEQINISNLPQYTVVGMRGEIMLGKVVGTEFGFAAGKDNFHMGLGILSPLALLIASLDDGEGGSIGGLLLWLACAASFVEHTNYHIRITDNFEVAPFLSLARFRYMYDRTDPFYSTDQFVSWSIGTKLSVLTKNNWVVNVSGERTQLYHTGRPAGWQAGLHVGYTFKAKNEE
ncbi:MAG: hypothetical protein KF687_07670 [Cyclobacteriaceae bacterium]|nr:hypothetical protein [Cyclobacteriaceae bacterium]